MCTVGTDLLEKMGIPKSYLVPTTHRILGITKSSLDISSAFLLHIEVVGKITRQMVHVLQNTKGLHLSERALLELGLLPDGFPSVSRSQSAPIIEKEPMGDYSTSKAASCDEDGIPCLERTSTPDIPDKLPFPATKENLHKFEQYFLTTFGASAFNTCTHQPLQGLSGESMYIKFKEGGVLPAYISTPIPVPHHWKKGLKADMDQDVCLGIIECPHGVPAWWWYPKQMENPVELWICRNSMRQRSERFTTGTG